MERSLSMTPQQQAERDRIALSLFQPARCIILHHGIWAFGPASLNTCRALLLAASYFAHMGRPLHNASMAHMTSRSLLQLFDERRRDGQIPESNERLIRVFWVCFMWEGDRIADFDVRRSGIEPLADKMPLPSSLDPEEENGMICFAAETAVRRLLNRIYSSLYAAGGDGGNDKSGSGSGIGSGIGIGSGSGSGSGSGVGGSSGDLSIGTNSGSVSGRTTPGQKRKRSDTEALHSAGLAANSLGQMLAMSTELNRQLEAWYSGMPDQLRPPMRRTAGGGDKSVGGDNGDDKDDDNGNDGDDNDDDDDDDDDDGDDDDDDDNDDDDDDDDNADESEDAEGDDDPDHCPVDVGIRERGRILRIRYCSACHLIHRPFILHVARQHQQQRRESETSVAASSASSLSSRAAASAAALAAGMATGMATGMAKSRGSVSTASGSGMAKSRGSASTASSSGPSDVILDKCALCVDACTAYLAYVSPLLNRRSPYLWLFCQRCLSCLLVLVLASVACPGVLRPSVDIGRLRDRVAASLRRWAVAGSGFAAELQIVENLPVPR